MSGLKVLIGLVGGLGIFLFGMKLCSEGLQKTAAHRLKHMVKVLTKSSWRAILVGTVLTIGLQSSSATSAIVVSLVSAKMMSLSQTLGILLGSAIGSSLTAQLIAFKITDLALILIFLGAIIYIFAKRLRRRSLGQILLGFGLIFYGMHVMAVAMVPVQDNPFLGQIIINLGKYPILAFLVAFFVTAIIQSSAGFMALLITLARQGLVSPFAIVPFVLGAHLGGTVTGVISSLGAPGMEAKRAAVANFIFKLINGLIFLPLYYPLTNIVLWSSPNVSRQIANAHTIFSFVMAAGFLPFTSYVARIMNRLLPDKKGRPDEAKYLKEKLLEIPELAVDQAHRQTVELGQIVFLELRSRLLPALKFKNDYVIDQIIETEKVVDSLSKKISKYVTSLNINNFSEELLLRSIQVLYTVNDLEHIGDILMNISQIGKKVAAENLSFSDKGFSEIEMLYEMVSDNLNKSLKAFENADNEAAISVIKEHPKLLRHEKDLRYNHFDRLQSGNKETAETSSVHLDLIEALLRIDNHSVNIAQGVMGIV